MAYCKHQLYLDDYEIKSGVVRLPDKCEWIVMKHVVSGDFTDDPDEDGGVCLILSETRSETRGFWAVMSFLTRSEVEKLRDQLSKILIK